MGKIIQSFPLAIKKIEKAIQNPEKHLCIKPCKSEEQSVLCMQLGELLASGAYKS